MATYCTAPLVFRIDGARIGAHTRGARQCPWRDSAWRLTLTHDVYTLRLPRSTQLTRSIADRRVGHHYCPLQGAALLGDVSFSDGTPV